MLKFLVWTAPLLVTWSSVFATTDGIDPNVKLRGVSRPCCGFIASGISSLMKFSGFVDPTRLGTHDFARLNQKSKTTQEGFGMVYTCRAGFVDIAHLRDNADWAAQIYLILQQKVGTGVSIPVQLETDLKEYTLELPKFSTQEIASLTPEVLAQAAVSLAFDTGIFHEIGTTFPQAVSGPKIARLTSFAINERNSAFSPEDVYSNLIGAELGMEAVLSSKPFNVAMTELLENRLQALQVVSHADANSVYQSLKGDWWTKQLSPHKVRKKNFDYTGTVSPRVPQSDVISRVCGASPKKADSAVPDFSKSTGLKASSIAYVRQVPRKSYLRKLKRKLGFTPRANSEITSEDFPVLVPAIREMLLKKVPTANTF